MNFEDLVVQILGEKKTRQKYRSMASFLIRGIWTECQWPRRRIHLSLPISLPSLSHFVIRLQAPAVTAAVIAEDRRRRLHVACWAPTDFAPWSTMCRHLQRLHNKEPHLSYPLCHGQVPYSYLALEAWTTPKILPMSRL